MKTKLTILLSLVVLTWLAWPGESTPGPASAGTEQAETYEDEGRRSPVEVRRLTTKERQKTQRRRTVSHRPETSETETEIEPTPLASERPMPMREAIASIEEKREAIQAEAKRFDSLEDLLVQNEAISDPSRCPGCEAVFSNEEFGAMVDKVIPYLEALHTLEDELNRPDMKLATANEQYQEEREAFLQSLRGKEIMWLGKSGFLDPVTHAHVEEPVLLVSRHASVIAEKADSTDLGPEEE